MNDLEKLFLEADADDDEAVDGKSTPADKAPAEKTAVKAPDAAKEPVGGDEAGEDDPAPAGEDAGDTTISEENRKTMEEAMLDPSAETETADPEPGEFPGESAEDDVDAGEEEADPLESLTWAPPPLDVKSLLEALLLVEKDGLKLRRVAHVTGLPYGVIKEAMDSLLLDYRARGGGLVILRERHGFVLATRSDLADDVQNFIKVREVKLSRAAYETLAVIAINQPVTKAEIERIRGVGADAMLSTLRSKNLVRVMGRKEVHGRPALYGVGMMFFKHFGIRSLKEFRSFARRLRMLGELPPPLEGQEAENTAVTELGDIAIAPPDGAVDPMPPGGEQDPGTAVDVEPDVDADDGEEWDPGEEPDDFDFSPRDDGN